MYRLQKIISAIILAATSFLAFLLFSNNISFCSINLALVAALCTLYCYNAHLFIGMAKQKRQILDWTLFILCLAVFLGCHSVTFNFKFISVAIVVMALAYLYLYGHALFPMRKTVWLKLIVLSLVWTLASAVLPITLYDEAITIKSIYETFIFLSMVLALSLPFEKRDEGVDAINNYTNIFTHYGPKQFNIVIFLALITPVVIALCGWQLKSLPANWFFATIICSTTAGIIFHSSIITKHNLYVLFDVLFLGWVCALFVIKGIIIT